LEAEFIHNQQVLPFQPGSLFEIRSIGPVDGKVGVGVYFTDLFPLIGSIFGMAYGSNFTLISNLS